MKHQNLDYYLIRILKEKIFCWFFGIEPIIWKTCKYHVSVKGYACAIYGIEYCGCDYCELRKLYRWR